MSFASELKKKRIRLFLDVIREKKVSHILDIGCQNGFLCDEIAKMGHRAYGIDILEESITKARSQYPDAIFKQADCEKQIPFEDGVFDIVWAGDVIEHVDFTDVFVNEINRVLKIGGLFILSTPVHNKLKNVLISLFCFERHFDPEFPHIRFYTINSLRSVLMKRGFTIQKVNYIGRIKPLAASMFIVSEKIENKMVMSPHRF